MNDGMLAKFLNYAVQEQVGRLVVAGVSGEPKRWHLHYHFADGASKTLAMPARLGETFISNLKKLVALAPGDLATKKYCRVRTKNCRLNFYLSVLPDKPTGTEKMILHIAPDDQTAWRLNQLGLRAAERRKLLAATESGGLILISSPDQNGKSTTLRALLAALNDERRSIYLFTAVPESTPAGINCLLPAPNNWAQARRGDADIIAADDLDNEAALTEALRTAATGRLVIGALTAESAGAILQRLIKLPLPLKLKLEQTKIIINQRLVPLRRAALAQSRPRRKNRRAIIGLFEFLPLTPAWRQRVTTASHKKSQVPWLVTEADGWRPLAADRRQKIKDGLIAA